MVTTKDFDNLKDLQDILVQKYDLEKKVAEAPQQLSTQEALLSRLKSEFIEKNTEYEGIKNTVNTLKAELDEVVKTRESDEQRLSSIETHREFDTLEKAINEAKDKEDKVRGNLHEEEKKLAELKEIINSSEEMINAQESDLNDSRKALNKQLDQYNKKLGDLKAKEDKITPKIDQEILFKFERIIQRNSEGIVAVKNGVCTGCHMILPANFANEVREGENIKFCPYCSRILYYEELSEDEAESYFDISAVGSLAGFDDDDLLDEDEELDEDERDEDSEDAFENEDSDLDDEDADDEDADDVDDEDDEDDEE